MKALAATDWPRADDPEHLARLRSDGDRLARRWCPFGGKHGPMTGGLIGMTETALGHLYHDMPGSFGSFGDLSLQCGCGARRARG